MTEALITVVLIAAALSMDAFAVSMCLGTTAGIRKKSVAFKAAVFFGGFQAAMPLLGWVLGFYLKEYIEEIDHWVAFGLLVFIGFRMISKAIRSRGCVKTYNITSIWVMLTLAVATSIDALAVGLSLALLNIPILLSAAIIGIITFCISYIGVFLGKKFCCILGNKAEFAGGIVLFLIGIKILIEHLFF
ncbi:MAG: manganese efflux pump MntP family protein [Bacteroidota bacterium]